MSELVEQFSLQPSALGHLTSAVQFGFIIGTLCFAIFTIADRYSPSTVFLVCALLGALFNLGTVIESNSFGSLISFRFFTGFFLAGIYPVGMKIASDYFEKGLGRSLGYLVGALVLGTAFPHLVKGITSAMPWKLVLIATSVLATFGGLIMYLLVPNGPFRKAGSGFNPSAVVRVFRNSEFRRAAFGYFGHMWELYTFWAFVPIILMTYGRMHSLPNSGNPFLSFLIIGVGGLACVLSGYLSEKLGPKRVAFYALMLSGTCCVLSPFMFTLESDVLFIGFLLFWGMAVIADSPLFSTLVAKNAEAEIKGTALTIVNSIGFAITIISIQLFSLVHEHTESTFIYPLLAIGPIFGLLSFRQAQNR